MTAICAPGLSSVAVAQTPLETWSGAEAFRKAWGLYAGATVAPVAWFDPDVRMRVVTGQSVYRYEAATGASQRGMSPFADVLLGLQKQWGALTVKGFAGVAALADVRTQAEAADLWHHTRLGPKVVLEAWWNLDAQNWAQVDAAWAAPAHATFLRIRGGHRVLAGLSLGLEGALAGNETGATLRVGPIVRYEWAAGEVSLSGGYASEGLAAWGTGHAVGGAPSPYATVNWLQKF